MEIVTGEPAPTLTRDEAVRLLDELAAVVRTIFAVRAQAPETAIPAPAAAPVPAATAPPTPAVPAGIPVPGLALPLPETPDSPDRHSLALLQEIAFLDE